MKLPTDLSYMEENLNDEYQRHNQELRKIRRFIRKKGPACAFEKEYLKSCGMVSGERRAGCKYAQGVFLCRPREKAKEEAQSATGNTISITF